MTLRPGVDYAKHLEKLKADMKYIDAQERVTRLDVTACYVAAKVCVSEFMEAVTTNNDLLGEIFTGGGVGDYSHGISED